MDLCLLPECTFCSSCCPHQKRLQEFTFVNKSKLQLENEGSVSFHKTCTKYWVHLGEIQPFYYTEHSQALPSGGKKIKKGKKCLKDKGTQFLVLKEKYFILHIWSKLRSRSTHLCQNKLLKVSGNDLVTQSSSNPCLQNKKLQKLRHQLPRKGFCLWIHLTA